MCLLAGIHHKLFFSRKYIERGLIMNYICVRISADKLDLDEISKELDFDNAACYKNGTDGEFKGEKIKYNEDIWLTKTVVDDNDLILTLEQITDKLYNKKSFFETLPLKCDFSVWITLYPESFQSNFRFCNDVLRKISEIGATLDLSVMDLQELYD